MFIPIIKDKVTSTLENHVFITSWYIIFMIIIPYLIKSIYSFDMLRFYLPVIDLIANIFASSGRFDRSFKDLYSLSPNNLISFLSTNFINLVALTGVSWNGILHAFERNDLWFGVTTTIFMYIMTYLVPTQMIPYIIRRVHQRFDEYIPDILKTHIRFMGTTIYLDDYIVGLILIAVLVGIEFLLIASYIDLLKYF